MRLSQLLRVLALIIISHSAIAQTVSEEQIVQRTVINVFDALSNKDADALRKLCTSDVQFYEYGEAWPIDTLIDKAIISNTVADFERINKLDFVSTTIEGSIAWTTYYLHSDITQNGKNFSVDWMETVILVREDQRWKIKVLHSTRIAKK